MIQEEAVKLTARILFCVAQFNNVQNMKKFAHRATFIPEFDDDIHVLAAPWKLNNWARTRKKEY